MKFKLNLLDNSGNSRIAILDTNCSQLFWEDNQKDIFAKNSFENKLYNNVHPTSITSPSGKSKQLTNIKIQLGFACNFTCNYCSQNSLRKSIKENINDQTQKTQTFINSIPDFFGKGKNGDGSDVAIEFWGGETLIYWESVKLLTIFFRNKFPQIKLGLFTNGSLINKEIADFALANKIHFIISHDGPTFSIDRSKDPLDQAQSKENIKYLFNLLNPLGLISFNATISIKNHSLIEIRKYIADKLNVSQKDIKLHHELATPYDKKSLEYVAKSEHRSELIQSIYNGYLKQYPFNIDAGNLNHDLKNFFDSFTDHQPLNTFYQKCNMDSPSSIAVDLDGNVLTCQNVTANSGHKIGAINDFQNVQLKTATHFLNRESCNKCPVVNICKGSCMFLKDEMWDAACEQHFTWSLAFLAFALKIQTGLNLIEINGEKIRNKEESTIKVII